MCVCEKYFLFIKEDLLECTWGSVGKGGHWARAIGITRSSALLPVQSGALKSAAAVMNFSF